MSAPHHFKAYEQGFRDRLKGNLYDSRAGWQRGSGPAYDAGWNAAGNTGITLPADFCPR
jgi:hypothetical protein